jgi:hypothetical protein
MVEPGGLVYALTGNHRVHPSHFQMAGMDRVNRNRGGIMATIVIKDLKESSELDRQAMLAISGGSRYRAGAAGAGRAVAQRVRLFDLASRAGGKPAAVRPPPR